MTALPPRTPQSALPAPAHQAAMPPTTLAVERATPTRCNAYLAPRLQPVQQASTWLAPALRFPTPSALGAGQHVALLRLRSSPAPQHGTENACQIQPASQIAPRVHTKQGCASHPAWVRSAQHVPSAPRAFTLHLHAAQRRIPSARHAHQRIALIPSSMPTLDQLLDAQAQRLPSARQCNVAP